MPREARTCCCCRKRSTSVRDYRISRDGVRYVANGKPAQGETWTACTEACAREAAYGTVGNRPRGIKCELIG